MSEVSDAGVPDSGKRESQRPLTQTALWMKLRLAPLGFTPEA